MFDILKEMFHSKWNIAINRNHILSDLSIKWFGFINLYISWKDFWKCWQLIKHMICTGSIYLYMYCLFYIINIFVFKFSLDWYAMLLHRYSGFWSETLSITVTSQRIRWSITIVKPAHLPQRWLNTFLWLPIYFCKSITHENIGQSQSALLYHISNNL